MRLVDPATRAVIEAFVAGINRGIEAMDADLPVEFLMLGYRPAPFTVRDVVAIARGFWWSLNGRIDRIMAADASRLLPEHLRTLYLTPEASENLVLPGATVADFAASGLAAGTDDATGSNNWAISGRRAAAGFPVLAGDPHQPFWVPASWYEFGLHGPEDDAAGCGHPGIPGFWWGSNRQSAWCLTNNMASTRDLYAETVDPADPGRYRDGAAWRNFAVRETAIPVRGEADRALTIRETVRGPIVNALVPSIDKDGDAPMSLRWVGMEHLDDLRAILGLGRAKSWEQFRGVLRDWSVAVFNWIYADRDGHVGYQMAGRIPIRGRTWPGVRDANDPIDAWKGYIPYEGMPHRYDPPGGVVASANQRIVGPDYPFPIYGAYSQGHRGVRLDEVFAASPRMDVADNIALQNDVKNVRATRTVPHILAALAGSDDAAARELAGVLGSWDQHYATGTPAPTLFETFMAIWNRRVLGLHLPAHLIDLAQQQTGLCTSVLEGAVPVFLGRAGGQRGGGGAGGDCAAGGAAGRGPQRLGMGQGASGALAPSAVGRGECRGVRHRAAAGGRRIAHAAQHRGRAAAARGGVGCGIPDRGGFRGARFVPRDSEHRQFGGAGQPALSRPVRAVDPGRVSCDPSDPGGGGGGCGGSDGADAGVRAGTEARMGQVRAFA